MRASSVIVLLVSAFAVAATVPGIAAATESKTGFVAWALERTGEMDLRWNRMTALGETMPSTIADGTGEASLNSLSSARIVRGTALSHNVIASRSFLHSVWMDARFLPLSTRERNGAARGVTAFQSPAAARLAMPNGVRRSIESSIHQKHFFRTFGTSVSRPKLESFGRIHRAERSHSRGVSRPASRAARPRIL
jgi:hypothetical protein